MIKRLLIILIIFTHITATSQQYVVRSISKDGSTFDTTYFKVGFPFDLYKKNEQGTYYSIGTAPVVYFYPYERLVGSQPPLTWATISDPPTIPSNTNQLTNSAGFLVAADISGKQNTITTGTTAQYFRGDLSLATFPTTTAFLSNSTDKNLISDAKFAVVNNTSGTNTGDNAVNNLYSGLVSNANHTGDATGSTALTLATVNGNVGSFTNASITVNGKGLITAASSGTPITGLDDDPDFKAYAALGSPFLAQTVGCPIQTSNTSTALVDGQIKFTAVYLAKAATITGIRVYVRTLGSYTPDNNNRVGLYTYSAGVLTLVASSANSGTLWTSAANAFQTIAFSSPYAASVGIYFVGILYNNSAQVTAPTIATGTALNNAAMAALAFTNSAKLYGTANGTDLTTPINMSAITASTIPTWVTLY
jgi:hypothetical protein